MTAVQEDRHRGAVIVVTGGASGIGRSCANRLLAEGASVVIADMNEDAANAAASELAGHDDRVLPVAVDVRSKLQCDDMVRECIDRFGSITGLVHSAGVN